MSFVEERANDGLSAKGDGDWGEAGVVLIVYS